MKVKFNEWNCIALPGHYKNGVKAIELIDEYNGECIAMATVNLHDHIPEDPDNIFVKDYSENEGMTEVLVKAGIISAPYINIHQSGYVNVAEYRLTNKGLLLFKTKSK